MATRIFLVRHGETEGNVLRVVQGQSGRASLTSRGRSQVSEAAQFLKSELHTTPYVWASDLRRAANLAELICQTLRASAPILCQELRQRKWGAKEGGTYDERSGELAYLGAPGAELPDDAESIDNVLSRLRVFLDRVRMCPGSAEHVIVSHNETLNYLIDLVRETNLRKRHISGGEIVRVEFDANGIVVDRPRSVFPPRFVYFPDVSAFFGVKEAMAILRDHDLLPIPSEGLKNNHSNVFGIVLGDSQFSADAAAPFPRLQAVSRFGTGVDNVDVEGLWEKRRITVARTPGVNVTAVSDYVLSMLVLLLRDVFHHAQGLRGGIWRSGHRGLELSDSTVAVIGTGRIGLEVARRLYRQEAEVLAWNRTWPPRGATAEDLESISYVQNIHDLVRRADAISIHLAHELETHHFFNASTFRAMRDARRSPVLVNTARGEVVDEGALLDALKEGIVRSAALDVWSAEGDQTNDTVIRLRGHPAVFATPHIAGATSAVVQRASIQCAENIVALIEGRRTDVADLIVSPQKLVSITK